MDADRDNNGPVLRGFLRPISGMFLYGEAPYDRSHPRRRLHEVALLLAAGRNHALLHHHKFRGQRARAQLHRQLLGRLDREIAADLP
jgi:hypothetical protein